MRSCCTTARLTKGVAYELAKALPVTIHPTLLGAHAVPPEFKGDVDIVYTWVDGDDPAWRADFNTWAERERQALLERTVALLRLPSEEGEDDL